MDDDHDWAFVKRVTHPALILAPASFLDDIRADLSAQGVQAAVARRQTAPIFDWLMKLVQLQGISDAIAFAYADKHGIARWADIAVALAQGPSCPKLRSYWHFEGCCYAKVARTCAEPEHLPQCPLPSHPLRKGGLNQAAYSLFLFIRNVCDGDLVTWIDQRLAEADLGTGAADRGKCMGAALVEPLRNVHGVSDKLLSMALAELLLGGDPDRERWVATGAAMIAIDTLVHNFMHRTGILRRLKAEHDYGARCYAPGGCAEIIKGLARQVDARAFNPAFPTCFPRFVQHALWRFCAQGVLNICNGNRINDRARCKNRYCPAFDDCDRVALNSDGG
jgi:hypothetical protein